MLIIRELKLRPGYSYDDLLKKVSSTLHVLPEDVLELSIDRQSIDARKKPDIFIILSVIAKVKYEESVLKHCKSDTVSVYENIPYEFPAHGMMELKHRPVVVGAGPCGLFAAYYLAREGYRPIVLERGYDIDSRVKDVDDFWKTGILNPNSNVIFGEGGAGAFSDGKLNTLVKDKLGRNKEVLRIFVENGADTSILSDAKPHIGTDVLVDVVKNIRKKIISFGGEFRFNAEFTDFHCTDGAIDSIEINRMSELSTNVLVLALGHSARNTFEMLYDRGIAMEQKDFAVGYRVEHRQSTINRAMYGAEDAKKLNLPPATYKLTHQASNNKGVYSFCMCPGGFVVNASSEPEHLCINGMSYSDRAGYNANSAIVVTVNKEDFGSDHPLAGISFQREIEKKAYEIGEGMIPVSYYGNLKCEILNKEPGLTGDAVDALFSFTPQTKGSYQFTSLKDVLPQSVNEAFVEGMEAFGKMIPGFNDDFSLVSCVESRTSSPVRIPRNEAFESVNMKGMYPSGEGAGYAGGITSACMDGLKIAEAIASKYRPF